MERAEFSDFDSLFNLCPDSSYDTMIRSYLLCTNTDLDSVVSTPWTDRALTDYRLARTSAAAKAPLVGKKRYKPVHRKVRPVPSYMPNPEAHFFREIPRTTLTDLPTHPPDYRKLKFGRRVTLERLELMLSKIPQGILSKEEIDLLAYIVVAREFAFAFQYSEKGSFSSEYYPDYEFPTIEHTPWQHRPIPIPTAMLEDVRKVILDNEASGRFEPTVSSYRCAMFPVAKKPGSDPPVRIILNLESLNAVTVQDAAIIMNVNEFAESFVGYAIYGLADLFSGFDAIWIHPKSRPLQAFHSPAGPKQQATMGQGYTNAMQEFSRRVGHALKPVAPQKAEAFIDDCGVKGPTSRYDDAPIRENPKIRRFVWEYAQNLDEFLGTLIMAGITASGAKTILAAFDLHIVGSVVSLEGWKISPSLVQRVLDWPIPTSVSEVRSFLGLAGGGRRWIKGFSIIAKPLTVLLRVVTIEFQITDEAFQAQEILKQKITSAPVLVRLDYKAAKSITRLPRTSDNGLMIVGVAGAFPG
jgi:hypothetical protein